MDSLLCCRRLDSTEGLCFDGRRESDTSPDDAIEELLEVLLRLGAGLSMSITSDKVSRDESRVDHVIGKPQQVLTMIGILVDYLFSGSVTA